MKKIIKKFNFIAIALILVVTSCNSDDNSSTPVNQISIENLTVDFDENPTNGDVVGTVQTAQTVGGATLSFSITSQTPAGALSIDATTGELTVANASLFDYEVNTTITANINVTGVTNSATTTINLNNVNEIGDYNYGGIVFWIDPSDETKGLVCALNDQNPIAGTPFGCSTTGAGASGVTIGTGQANTNAIMAVCSEVGAAYLATNLNANSYNDWFLPSEDEFYEISLNNIAINASLTANGGINFSSAYYWTSTEFNSLNGKATNPINGFLALTGKSVLNKVRAIRAF
jgi:hypothetical protein